MDVTATTPWDLPHSAAGGSAVCQQLFFLPPPRNGCGCGIIKSFQSLRNEWKRRADAIVEVRRHGGEMKRNSKERLRRVLNIYNPIREVLACPGQFPVGSKCASFTNIDALCRWIRHRLKAGAKCEQRAFVRRPPHPTPFTISSSDGWFVQSAHSLRDAWLHTLERGHEEKEEEIKIPRPVVPRARADTGTPSHSPLIMFQVACEIDPCKTQRSSGRFVRKAGVDDVRE